MEYFTGFKRISIDSMFTHTFKIPYSYVQICIIFFTNYFVESWGSSRLLHYIWVFRIPSQLTLIKMEWGFETSPIYLSVQMPLGKQVCDKMLPLKYSSLSLTNSWNTAISAMKLDSCSEDFCLQMLFSSLGYDAISNSALMELLTKHILTCA